MAGPSDAIGPISTPLSLQPGIAVSGLFSLILIHSNRLNLLESTDCWMFLDVFTAIYRNTTIFLVIRCPPAIRL